MSTIEPRPNDPIRMVRKDSSNYRAGSLYDYESDLASVPVDALHNVIRARIMRAFNEFLPAEFIEELRTLIGEERPAEARCRFMRYTHEIGVSEDVRELFFYYLCPSVNGTREYDLTALMILGTLRPPQTIPTNKPPIEFRLEDFIVTDEHRRGASVLAQCKWAGRVVEEFQYLASRITRDLEAELAELPYRQFLQTPYWRTLRDYVNLRRGQRCERCNARQSPSRSMHVHHKDYSHRGSEWRYLEDLEVLCADCHTREHS